MATDLAIENTRFVPGHRQPGDELKQIRLGFIRFRYVRQAAEAGVGDQDAGRFGSDRGVHLGEDLRAHRHRSINEIEPVQHVERTGEHVGEHGGTECPRRKCSQRIGLRVAELPRDVIGIGAAVPGGWYRLIMEVAQ